ncbi:envelope integrity protein Cei [Gordonia desulfuricans]|uniref:envelope integrity protein Cei n=1 Tax=Gordonia desulfuricans TaxID=89051 RepID=UPI00073F584A|nr:envelope integrity protein Cei [Gordonia desulfuricans]
MVSQITTGYPTDHNGRPIRRRSFRPAIILLAVLVVLAVIVWTVALSNSEAAATPTDCNQPTPATPTATDASGAPTAAPASTAAPTVTVADRDEMLAVSPASLATFQVRVLNASTTRGAARSASDDLTHLGFTPATDSAYGDDPIYPNHDLNCVAQIRFGPAGKAAAAAVWLAIPCAQLVDDGRRDTTVDVALGEHYRAQEQSQDAQAALEALRSADPKSDKNAVDPGLVSAVHAQKC